MCVSCACRCPWSLGEGIRSFGTSTSSCEARGGRISLESRTTDSCELQCGCWDPNLGPFKKQAVLLST